MGAICNSRKRRTESSRNSLSTSDYNAFAEEREGESLSSDTTRTEFDNNNPPLEFLICITPPPDSTDDCLQENRKENKIGAMKPVTGLSIALKTDDDDSDSEYSTDSEYDGYLTPINHIDLKSLDTPQITMLYTDRNQYARGSIVTPRITNVEFALNDLVEVRNDEDEEWQFGIVKRESPIMVTLRNSLLRRKYTFIRHSDPSEFPIDSFCEGMTFSDGDDSLSLISPGRMPEDSLALQKRALSRSHESLNSESSHSSNALVGICDSGCKRVRWRQSFLPARNHYSCEELISAIDKCLRATLFDEKLISLIRLEFLSLDPETLQKKQIRIDPNIPCDCGRPHTPVVRTPGSKVYVYLKPNQIVQNSISSKGARGSESVSESVSRHFDHFHSKDVAWALQSKEVAEASVASGVPRSPSPEWEVVLFVGSKIFQWILLNKLILSPSKKRKINEKSSRQGICEENLVLYE